MVILSTLKKEISINCFLISLQFDAHVRNIANLDFSIYWSFMISAGLELPADLLSIVGLEQLGRHVWLFSSFWTRTTLVELRRWSSNLSLLGSGIAILPCAWLTVSKTKKYKMIKPVKHFNFQERLVAQAVLAMIARFFATYAMNTNFQFTVEVDTRQFPLESQNTVERKFDSRFFLLHWEGRGWLLSMWCQCSARWPPQSSSTRFVFLSFWTAIFLLSYFRVFFPRRRLLSW